MYQYKVSWDQKKNMISFFRNSFGIRNQTKVIFFCLEVIFFGTEFVHFSWIFLKIQCIIFTYNVGVNIEERQTLHVYKFQEVFIIFTEALKKINKCL